MLRNTSDGNELALPLQCLAKKEHSEGCWILRIAAHALVCRGPRPVAALAAKVVVVSVAVQDHLPVGAKAGGPELRSEGNT